jgi:hypothetical protein
LIVRPDGLAAIHIEPTVAPIHHAFNNHISDFAFSFEHFEHFKAKQLFKITPIGQWAYHKGVVVDKAAVGGQHM